VVIHAQVGEVDRGLRSGCDIDDPGGSTAFRLATSRRANSVGAR
jgi:hypothetical protein